jgi:hypothetical protein
VGDGVVWYRDGSVEWSRAVVQERIRIHTSQDEATHTLTSPMN